MITKQSPKQSSSDPLGTTILKITDAFVGYRDKVLTLGECHDNIENLITDCHLQKCRSYLLEVIGEDDRY